MPAKRNLFVLSGPSGAGKNSVYDGVRALLPEMVQTVSATTRAPRAGEIHGVDYYFISRAEFERRIKTGDFIEYVEYGGSYYGTLKSEIERLTAGDDPVMLIIEVNGALRVKELFPEAVTIFIVPPSVGELERRIRARGQNSEQDLQTRLEIAQREMQNSDRYDHCVVNDVLETCIKDVYKIIKGA